MGKDKCKVCGCTDDSACPGGCYWVEKNLCSQCSISARLQFHITSDDYFGTLATILSLDRESGEPTGQKVIDDLMHLQRNYKIVKK